MSATRRPPGAMPADPDSSAAPSPPPSAKRPDARTAPDSALPPGTHTGPEAAAQTALLRLRASRLRLALALAAMQSDHRPDHRPDAGPHDDDRFGEPAGSTQHVNGFDRRGFARDDPQPHGAPLLNSLLDDVLDTLGRGGHVPLTWLAWRVGRTVGRDWLATWSTRHPWRLVGAAALIAGGLVAVRPWRWLIRPAVMAGLLVQLVTFVRKRRATPAPASPLNPPPAGRWRRTAGPRPGVFR